MKKLTPQSQKTIARSFYSVTTRARLWLLVLLAIAVTGGLLISFVANGSNQDTIKVSLDKKSAVSQVRQADVSVQSGESALRVAIAGVLSPTSTLEYYQELLAFMGQKLGRQVTLVLKPTYSEINDLVKGQRVDMALVCSLAYVKGNEDFGMELLAAPQVRGGTVYYSYLIVPKDSSATSLADLKSADFAFTDPMSNSGYLAPVYQLHLRAEQPASFFSKYIFTYSHNNSITVVADKLLGGAAVDSLVYDQLMVTKPQLAAKTKIITRWGPYGIPPVVVSPALDSPLRQRLQNLLLGLHESDEGRAILAGLGIDKFVVISDDEYDSIRQMKTQLGW
ncbi:MAG: phosphate/phosphite/phosphonate ABC transporter substrate-binding protein [Candidatus Marsarchaeota archaeon]|nr:phosphate/phosphite/phosphonate ABC transporter substrate-binding protein [Candidatus Marsarchaeota archaeon]